MPKDQESHKLTPAVGSRRLRHTARTLCGVALHTAPLTRPSRAIAQVFAGHLALLQHGASSDAALRAAVCPVGTARTENGDSMFALMVCCIVASVVTSTRCYGPGNSTVD